MDTAEDFTVAFVGSRGAEGAVPVQDALILERAIGVDVVLGLQFFRRLSLQVDYRNARFRYMTRSATDLAKTANARARMDGGWLTGSKPAGEATISGVIEDAETDLRLLNAMKLGPYELNDLPILVENRSDSHKSRPAPKLGSRVVLSEDADPGILGFDVLRHLVVTLDLENGLLHIQ